MKKTSALPSIRSFLVTVIGALTLSPTPSLATDAMAEQVIYLPIYSHIYYGDLDKDGLPSEKLLSAHVSIRNTDPRGSIRVLYARYYDTNGKLVKDFIKTPKVIPAMGTAELFVPRADASGGSGANFVIAWKADGVVNPPLVEAIHATIEMSRTLTFTTQGRPIQAR